MNDKTEQATDDEVIRTPEVIEAPAAQEVIEAPVGSVMNTNELTELQGVATSWLPSPQTFDEAMRFADMLANSRTVPKDFQGQPGDVLIAVQMGLDVGLSWAQSLQNIAVINGRPTMWGDAVLAVVRASGKLQDIVETFEGEWSDNIGDNTLTAVCAVKRKGEKRIVRHEFSMADAKRAGLSGGNVWTKYPRRMLQMRARSLALRDKFPDVLKGIAVREEQMTIVGEEITATTSGPASRMNERIAPPVSDAGGDELPSIERIEELIAGMTGADDERAYVASLVNTVADAKEKRRIGKLFSDKCRALSVE